MRQFQLVVLLLTFFFSSQPKYSCSIESWTKSNDEKDFCSDSDGIVSMTFVLSIVLSLFIERIAFKKSVMSLLAIYALLALFSMTTEHYLALHIFQQTLAITSMVLRNLVLVVALNRASLRQKAIVIVLYRILDIIGMQLPTAVFGLAEHYAFQGNPALFLYDFATGLLVLMMVFNSFHRGSYRSIATSEKPQEMSHFPPSDPSLFGLFTDVISVPKFTVLIYVMIGCTCSYFTKILSTMDVYAEVYHPEEFPYVPKKLYSVGMGMLWVATELSAAVAFVVIMLRFGKNLKGVIIVSMLFLTLSSCALGFLPIPLALVKAGKYAIAPVLHKYLFHVAQFSAILTTLSCILAISTTLRSGLRCTILTIFTASPLILSPIVRELESLLSSQTPSFIMLNASDLHQYIRDTRPFLLFAVWTIAVFTATLFIQVEQQEEDYENSDKAPQQEQTV